MASARPAPQTADRKLVLLEVLGWIEAEGMLAADHVSLLRGLAERGVYDGQHPLSVIGRRSWPDARDPGKALNVETLTQWLAARVKLPYFRIDPLKLDVRRITGVISQGYASRFKVLPVEVTADEIVVATAEPYEREWEREISQIQRKKIRRVLVNPDEISRYLVEFYSISRSVCWGRLLRVPWTARRSNQSILKEISPEHH